MNDRIARSDENHDTWNLLAVTYRLIAKLWDHELMVYDVTREKALNLEIIKHLGENATPYRISRFQVQEHNTVSDMIERLEKQGLVTKVRESQGNSRVKVRLTKLGERTYRKTQDRNTLNQMMSVLSAAEMKQLRLILSKLMDQVMKEYEKEKEWPEIRIFPSEWPKKLRNKPPKKMASGTVRKKAVTRKKITKQAVS